MKIKKCSYFLSENLENDFENLDYMYHSIDPKDYDSVMKVGLLGEIFLTKTPEEAREYHPLVLKVDVKDRKLNIKDNGKCSVMGVTIDKIIDDLFDEDDEGEIDDDNIVFDIDDQLSQQALADDFDINDIKQVPLPYPYNNHGIRQNYTLRY